MAEAAQRVGLVLYNPPHAKRVLAPAEIGRLAQQVPALVGVKVADGDEAWYAAMKRHAGRLSIFVPGHHLATGISPAPTGPIPTWPACTRKRPSGWCDQIKSDLPAPSSSKAASASSWTGILPHSSGNSATAPPLATGCWP